MPFHVAEYVGLVLDQIGLLSWLCQLGVEMNLNTIRCHVPFCSLADR